MDIKELVDLCKKGNEQALSLLYKTYSKKDDENMPSLYT